MRKVPNFQVVAIAASGPQVFTCVACGRKINQAHTSVYADLNGAPFKDYYHADCKPTYDFRIDDHGSIQLFVPLNQAARDWVTETAPEDAQWWRALEGSALVVEPRYMEGVVQAAEAAGFNVVAIV